MNLPVYYIDSPLQFPGETQQLAENKQHTSLFSFFSSIRKRVSSALQVVKSKCLSLRGRSIRLIKRKETIFSQPKENKKSLSLPKKYSIFSRMTKILKKLNFFKSRVDFSKQKAQEVNYTQSTNVDDYVVINSISSQKKSKPLQNKKILEKREYMDIHNNNEVLRIGLNTSDIKAYVRSALLFTEIDDDSSDEEFYDAVGPRNSKSVQRIKEEQTVGSSDRVSAQKRNEYTTHSQSSEKSQSAKTPAITEITMKKFELIKFLAESFDNELLAPSSLINTFFPKEIKEIKIDKDSFVVTLNKSVKKDVEVENSNVTLILDSEIKGKVENQTVIFEGIRFKKGWLMSGHLESIDYDSTQEKYNLKAKLNGLPLPIPSQMPTKCYEIFSQFQDKKWVEV